MLQILVRMKDQVKVLNRSEIFQKYIWWCWEVRCVSYVVETACVVGWPGWTPGAHQSRSTIPLLSLTGEIKYDEKLVGQDKER